jgi:hypothetical protein
MKKVVNLWVNLRLKNFKKFSTVKILNYKFSIKTFNIGIIKSLSSSTRWAFPNFFFLFSQLFVCEKNLSHWDYGEKKKYYSKNRNRKNKKINSIVVRFAFSNYLSLWKVLKDLKKIIFFIKPQNVVTKYELNSRMISMKILP